MENIGPIRVAFIQGDSPEENDERQCFETLQEVWNTRRIDALSYFPTGCEYDNEHGWSISMEGGRKAWFAEPKLKNVCIPTCFVCFGALSSSEKD
jgi:hypothetical protein